MIDAYNVQVFKWEHRRDRDANVDDFVVSDDTKISWSESLKRNLQRGKAADFSQEKVRTSLYRPFTKSNLYFDRMMTERVYVFPFIFPIPETENRVICVNITKEKPFTCLMVDCIPDLVAIGGFGSPGQCFPFYTYDKDGGNRRENITDWALAQFRAPITKMTPPPSGTSSITSTGYSTTRNTVIGIKPTSSGICHTCRMYALDFWGFAKAGQRLGEIHIGYEEINPNIHYVFIENREVPINWRVEKMKLSKDKTHACVQRFPDPRRDTGEGV